MMADTSGVLSSKIVADGILNSIKVYFYKLKDRV
jgi:hypothetical protein